MDLDMIKAFLAIYQYGSISAAAQHNYTSQSNLSTKIAHLEKELNVELIARGKGKKQIELTAQGEQFLEIAKQIDDALEQAENIKHLQNKNYLSIGATANINSFTLVPFYQQFIHKHPDIIPTIHTFHTTEIYDRIVTGRMDVGITANLKSSPGTKSTPIFEEPMVLLTHRKSPYYNGITPSELPADKEVYVRWSDAYEAWHNTYWGGKQYKLRLSVGNNVLQYITEPDNWAIVTIGVALELTQYRPLSVYSLSEMPPTISYYLVERNNEKHSTHTNTFIQELYEYIRNDINIISKIK